MHRRKRTLTAIGVSLGAVAVLQAIGPGALVLGVARGALAHAVAPLVALCPLAAVQPPPARLHAQPMPLAVLPLPLKWTSTVKETSIVKIKMDII